MVQTSGFKTKKLLTRPILKMDQGVARYVRIEGAMYIGRDMKEKVADGGKKKEPATICDVVNLEDGSLMQIILNAVLKSVLSEEYPNDTYVGKCFGITKLGHAPGKAYNSFRVEEIEDPATSTDSAASASDSSAAHASKGNARGRAAV